MYVDLFGCNDCGLIVLGLINKLGQSAVEKMDMREFARLVAEQCKKQGVKQPKPFDPFEAMQRWLDYANSRSARK